MSSRLHGFWSVGLVGLTLALLGLGANPAAAAKVIFRNDATSPVVVQGTIIVNGQVQRGKALVIRPGQMANYDSMPAGNTLVTIYDATMPNRVLYQNTITVGNDDLFFSVQADPPLPRAKLVPGKVPMGP
jgi:hypothetical protein